MISRSDSTACPVTTVLKFRKHGTHNVGLAYCYSRVFLHVFNEYIISLIKDNFLFPTFMLDYACFYNRAIVYNFSFKRPSRSPACKHLTRKPVNVSIDRKHCYKLLN